MSKRNADYCCPYSNRGCTKQLKQDGMNEENLERHIKFCKYAPTPPTPTIKKKGIISSYFSRNVVEVGEPSSVPSVTINTANSAGANICIIPGSDAGEIEASLPTEDDNDANNAAVVELSPEEEVSVEEYLSLPGNTKASILCQGFQITMQSGSVLSRYPFHRHDAETQDESTLIPYNISLTHGTDCTELVAHALTCDGSLSISSDNKVNKDCADIEYSPSMKKLIEIGESDTPHEKMKIDMLSFDQLKKKCREMSKKADKERLDTLTLVRKNRSLMKQVTLNNRFRELITTQDIPNLHILLQVCSRQGMGLQSILGRIGDAINATYRIRKYGENEWDIATLVLRIGGPKLLHILHKTHGLPAPDSTRRHANKAKNYSVAVDVSFSERIKSNMTEETNDNCIRTLKMDEIATESRLRWNSTDNKILGLCYQHSHNTNMSFNRFEDVQLITEEIKAGHIHRTKETLVVAYGEVGNGGKVQSILALPSCKAESEQFALMIDAAAKEVAPDVIGTDGCGQRRKEFANRDTIIDNKNVKEILCKLPLFDLHIINGIMALYFDDKHNGKRFRGVLISDSRGCLVNGTIISKSQLKYMFDEAGIKNYKDVLSPKDRQNVPSVLKLVEMMKECISKTEDSEDQVCIELQNSVKILIHVFDGILCIFSSPKMSLREQLTKLSTLAHILHHQFKEFGTKFIPGQLYHDLQRMVQGAYFSCVLLKIRGGGKMYMYQLGTDQVENVFGTVRVITHSRNCDVLELSHRLQHGEEINQIIAKHPAWKRFHGKRLGSYHDTTSQSDWTGDLEVNNISFYQMWIFGRAKACELLNVDVSTFDARPGCSMLRPKKRLVGVTVDTEREEVFESVDTLLLDTESSEAAGNVSIEEGENDEESLVSLEIEEFIEDAEQFGATVEVEGKTKHKASVVRMLFNQSWEGASVDRLRRVRSYTKYLSPGEGAEQETESEELDLDEIIMIGDSVCGKVMMQGGKACFAVGKITSIRDIEAKKFKTVSPVQTIEKLQFQVKICHGRINGEKLQLLQSSSGLMTWKGTHCLPLQLSHMELDLFKATQAFKSLPIVDGQHVDLSCLPYHQSLEISVDPAITADTITCRICGNQLEQKLMRKHVGEHIIRDKMGIVCGFCGLDGCSVDLVRGSGRGKNTTLVPGGNCEYLHKFSIKSAEKSTKSGPCTNRPVACEVCKVIVWSYNLPEHYRKKHTNHPIPSQITAEERKFMGLDK